MSAREIARATDAIAGAEALGVLLVRNRQPRGAVSQEIHARFGYDLGKSLDTWCCGYAFTSGCDQTVPVAFRAFLETESHEAAIRAAVSLGDDPNTVACMAGALAGAYWGIPQQVAEDVARRLEQEQLEIVTAFECRFPSALGFSAR